jgi:hypothetical protein
MAIEHDHPAIRRIQPIGEGVQNYMNDAPVDVGIASNPGNPTTPIEGVTLPGSASSRSDGFSSDIFKVQFSFKYNFSKTF